MHARIDPNSRTVAPNMADQEDGELFRICFSIKNNNNNNKAEAEGHVTCA